MAAHMQGLGKLTSKFFLMRKQHDHVKGPTEQATARSLQLTSIGRLLINLHNDTAPSDYAGRLRLFDPCCSLGAAINNEAGPPLALKSAISSSAGRASDAFLVRRISCFIDRLFARWVSGV